MAMKNPPHPGDFIKTEIVEAARVVGDGGCGGAWGFAAGVSSLLNGKAGLSGEMALRIEKTFGVRMDTLMRMQSAYEIAADAEAGEADSGGAGFAGGLICGNVSDRKARVMGSLQSPSLDAKKLRQAWGTRPKTSHGIRSF